MFKGNSSFYILLRPDNHISYIGQDLGKYLNFLKKYCTK